jgi:hypothetical protein
MEELGVLEGGSQLSPANLFTCIGSIYMYFNNIILRILKVPIL